VSHRHSKDIVPHDKAPYHERWKDMAIREDKTTEDGFLIMISSDRRHKGVKIKVQDITSELIIKDQWKQLYHSIQQVKISS
jgi:hypothetical protein